MTFTAFRGLQKPCNSGMHAHSVNELLALIYIMNSINILVDLSASQGFCNPPNALYMS